MQAGSQSPLPSARRVIYARRKVANRQSKGREGRTYPSDELISTFSRCKCADVRDHVFRLVGLVDKEELARYPITIDYSQSIETLFYSMYERRWQQLLDLNVEDHPGYSSQIAWGTR